MSVSIRLQQIVGLFAVASVLSAAIPAEAGPKKHRKAQKFPMKLGTSGGNATDFAEDAGIDLPCVSGTLGALVEGGGKQYILSTNASIAKRNTGDAGNPVIQPGLIDSKGGACNTQSSKLKPVADLTKFKKIKFHKGGKTPKNQSDAALAEVREGAVDPNGTVLDIGVPGSHVVAPFLGQQVQKAGRGTGVKTGTVVALNITGDVDYGFPPGSGPRARMIKQFVVQSNDGKAMMSFGDSGSVFFENLPSCPGLVGLGIAVNLADPQFALVTKMSTVLKQLGKVKPKDKLEPVGCKALPATAVVAPSSERLAAIRDAERIQRRVEDVVLELPGVSGIGIGLAADGSGEVVFKILVADRSSETLAAIPARLGKVRTELMGATFGAI